MAEGISPMLDALDRLNKKQEKPDEDSEEEPKPSPTKADINPPL